MRDGAGDGRGTQETRRDEAAARHDDDAARRKGGRRKEEDDEGWQEVNGCTVKLRKAGD